MNTNARRLITICLFSCLPLSFDAFAITTFLTGQYSNSQGTFCKYDNGTVTNAGINLCPLSIDPNGGQSQPAPSSSSGSMTTFLVKQYRDSKGNNICEYGDGSRINSGINLCPLSRKQ